ncbi:(Fe-S)-binding protein [Vibrio natriegens]|uniref:(Fe-S)-binding protein n=1 Tax=Vibrio natriegens TaxID=691 RepID=UPI0008045213|nr:(Fe-S)-binding protein [Vibrio natriegens]ANQ28855.1 (Fe-S)-binding protein [Vibrio natriegens]MCY9877093.1 (Fe-S)-binding protein [Vibrio natriegens]
MFLESLLPILLITAGALAVIGMLRRIMMWRRGQAESVAFFAGLAAMPRRYLVDLHHVVARDKVMSNTHVATAGGFVLSVVLIFAVHVFNLEPQILSWVLLGSLGLMFCGALFVAKRRLNPPSRLSKGPWMRLPKSLIMFSVSFFIVTLPATQLVGDVFNVVAAVVLLAAIVWGVGEMFLGMGWGGPMKHAFAGALHLAFHRRPERFGGGRSTGLKPIDLDAKKLGVENPSDFKWNQLLGFDACVQCGRCEAVCPAFAAGQPLNPKKLIQDMVVGLAGGTDEKYAGSPYPGKETGCAKGDPHKPIVGGVLNAETLWSCTTCRACVEECPMMIEHVDAIVDMRRFLTLEKGETPNKGAEVLENIIFTDNPNGHNPNKRSNWAADQDLKLMSEVKRADVLFWVSDGAFDMRSQRILKSMVQILKAAKIDVAILGDEELDCGDVARRLGDDVTYQRLAKRNIQTLMKYDFDCIVTTDPHAFHCLKNEYPDFYPENEKPNYQVWHHTTFINQLVEKGLIGLKPLSVGKVTYHDPCYLGRYNGEYEAPRSVLKHLGVEIAEMERSGFRSRCCGGGGAAPITDIPGERRIADMRMDDIRETGADLVAVGCQQCTAMLEGVVEPRPEVKDIAELVAEMLVEISDDQVDVWTPESETVGV